MTTVTASRSGRAWRWPATFAAWVAITVAFAFVLLEPPAGDRWHLVAILVGPALVAGAITPVLSRWVSHRASIAGAALAVALCSLVLATVTSSAASNAMFVSTHDYKLFVVVLVLSSGIAVIVGARLSSPLARDVERVGRVAQQVADGDLTSRTGVDRHDEVGATAAAIDRMVEALAAAEAERMRMAGARRHLLASLGHDLRTPLGAMRAAVESLQDGVAPDPDRYLAIIAGHIATLDGMLDQLVEFARLESGHVSPLRERLSIAELADECADVMRPLAASRGVTITVDATDPAFVDGHPVELPRVLRNLVDNAIRHAAGSVRIDVGIVEDRAVGIAVLDDGPGFPPEFRDEAFDPFTRADPARRHGNAGLGLAICRFVVDLHGGSIRLGPGPGGDVRITLPTPEAP